MNPTVAPFTRLIVGANIAVHLLVMMYLGKGGSQAEQFFRDYGLVASDFWTGLHWKPWQPLTSMFLHGGFLHLGFNMLGVWSLGIPVERTIGSFRFAALYMVSGLAGALAVILFQGDLSTPTIGASGALLGLMGAIAVFYPQSQMLVFFFPMRARTAAFVFGGISLAFALYDDSSGISHWGHLGGLVGGIVYSKFALGLTIARNHFSAQPMSGFFAGRMSRRTEEDELTRFLRTFFTRGQAPPGRPPYPPGEKIINPTPGDVNPRGTGPYSAHQGQGPQGKLYYDPVTGRFFFR